MTAPEVLVVVGDPQEQRDLGRFLTDLGMQPTVVGDAAQAAELCEQRPFAVALLDNDSPVPGAALEMLWTLKRKAPAISVIILTASRSFDGVLRALRGGASDVVIKTQDQIGYLRQRVLTLCQESQGRAERERLLGESHALNEDFLRRLSEMARRVGDLRDQLASGKSGASPLPGGTAGAGGSPVPRGAAAGSPLPRGPASATSQGAEEEECRILVVEEDGWLSGALRPILPKGFSLQTVVSGGSALDKASEQRFQIALVKEGLPDLPGRMVVRTLQAQSPETITLLFVPPGEKPGQVRVVEGSHMIPLVPVFQDPVQLAMRLGEIRQAQQARGRERRYLTAFREENHELLRRFAELRQKLGKI